MSVIQFSLSNFETGGYHYIPKAIEEKNYQTINTTEKKLSENIYFTDPQQNWLSQGDQQAIFRLIADVSLDFLVLSELWILKVGHLFDEKLSLNAYGNRIRRMDNGQMNLYAHGTFKPYLKPYKDWKKDALDAIYKSLNENRDVIAITGDISNFYPSLHPDFLLNDEFLKIINIQLDKNQQKLTRIFITAIKQWGEKQKRISQRESGLPVGVPASSLIANIALFEFDKIILNDLCPIHFGRYVDDILLVLDNTAHRQTEQEIWNHICSFFHGILSYDGKKICFTPSYLRNSCIQFQNRKNKIFILTGIAGKNYIKSIQKQINNKSSEWRAMPNISDDPDAVSADIASVVEENGEFADNLRCSEKLTIRRSSFAIKLRDIESMDSDLPSKTWIHIRHAFFDACLDNILVLPRFFEFSLYFPRIIQLAISCKDFAYVAKFAEKLKQLKEDIRKISKLDEYQKWECFWEEKIYESIVSAFPFTITTNDINQWNKSNATISGLFTHKEQNRHRFSLEIKDLIKRSKVYYIHDLGRSPFRTFFFGRRTLNISEYETHCVNSKNFLPPEIIKGITLLPIRKWMAGKYPIGIPFATRPLNLIELYELYNNLTDSKNLNAINDILFALRGFKPAERMPFFRGNILYFENTQTNLSKINISLACWHTDLCSCIAAIKKSADPDTKRYSRFSKLIDGILQTYPSPHYFIMPELSVPYHWFCKAALKLAKKNISFIAGIEYLHGRKHKIYNLACAALRHDALGFPTTMLYFQRKQTPALGEKKELRRIANLEFPAQYNRNVPPILYHNNLFFSILICSELTNIAYRSALRGNIDILFVPAWNRDLETFNALVESSALDIHAYIVECNDQAYGDSRVRGPFKESWQRDIARLKGGNNDYFVNVSLDIEILRRFQSSFDSPSAPFKPVPDGFKLNYLRKALPLKEKQND